MPANVLSAIAAGLSSGWYTLLDTDGYATGASGTVATGAAGTAAGRVFGMQNADLAIVEPETVPVPGDDGVLGTFLFAPNESPGGVFEIGVRDLTLESRLQSTLVQTLGNLSIGVIQPKDPLYVDVGLILSRQAQSQDGASLGKAMYENAIILKGAMAPLGNTPFQGRTAAVVRYRVIANPSNGTPMGFTLTNSANGTEAAPFISFFSDFPVTMHAFRGDGTTTAFVVGQTPASTTAGDHMVFVNGNRIASPTINTANRTFTITPAPASNAKITIVYQYVP